MTTAVPVSDIQQSVSLALSEDLGGLSPSEGDITANLIPLDHQASAKVITREDCIVCGQDWVNQVFEQVDPSISIDWLVNDGDSVKANATLFKLQGSARSILTGERAALNFLQTLSATATVTAKGVSVLADSNTQLLDTRKTIPGLRTAQKYAVTCGGGKNHRVGLFDAFLIKENHIAACGGINNAVAQAKRHRPDRPVEVEVESIDELKEAIEAGADIAMLDNFSIDAIKAAVSLNEKRVKLEVSGNVTVDRLTTLADLGVDFISSGALTKNVQAIDLSLRIID